MMSVKRLLLIARRQGLRFVYLNLMQRLLFDLRHGTDTTRPLAKDSYETKPSGFLGGNEYSGAFTDEIVWAFRHLHRVLGKRLGEYFFADIGCGKGKVLIVWNQCLKSVGTSQRTIGIEYYEPLVRVAVRNYVKVFGTSPEILHADAGNFRYGDVGRRAIFFLYNPFDARIMASFARAVDDIECFVVYNNPRHADVLVQSGFIEVARKSGSHVNENTIVFHRGALTA